ncbi:glycosyltransferase [Nocardioides salsibiostraticola]
MAVQTGSSAILIEHLLRAWRGAYPDDTITVLSGPEGPAFTAPSGVEVEALQPPVPGAAGRIWLRSAGVRRAADALGADALLSGVPASGLLGSRCRRGVILYDLRHELRPDQFSRRLRAARRLSWSWSMRRADRIFTISERTLTDLGVRHPRAAAKGVAAPLGSDHVTAWPDAERVHPPYALAFGHFANKNADAVIRAWTDFSRDHEDWTLRLVGMGASDRSAAGEEVRRAGTERSVELMPWLDDAQFTRLFVGASLVVFPSDFEGFGLPAVEALRLGIPLVISSDAALAEVTGGHAQLARSMAPDEVSRAMARAVASSAAEIEAGREQATRFSWMRMAETIRSDLSPRDHDH